MSQQKAAISLKIITRQEKNTLLLELNLGIFYLILLTLELTRKITTTKNLFLMSTCS